MVEVLLNDGADINAKSFYGFTALHEAARINADPAVLELLLERGADPHLTNYAGQTACQLLRDRFSDYC